VGTIPFFAPLPGAAFALDFDFDLVVDRLFLSFFGVEYFKGILPFCFSAETSMSRVSLNGGSGFSRDDARVIRAKLPSGSGVVLRSWKETREFQRYGLHGGEPLLRAGRQDRLARIGRVWFLGELLVFGWNAVCGYVVGSQVY
jgi:hypothetical protein